jgi:hypothetical protein
MHMVTRACTHSPVLRKSKIAVSLNSFPLAAWTAFVLQTKRKRNETRAQKRREKEGDRPANTQRKGETRREGGMRLRKRGKDKGKKSGQRTGKSSLREDPGPLDIDRASNTLPQVPERKLQDGQRTWERGNLFVH